MDFMLFQLAENLSMTVSRLCDELTYDEMTKWILFYKAKEKRSASTDDMAEDTEWTPDKVKGALSL